MEVLLLTDLPGIGKKNDLLVVGNGYALNFLLPARKAIVVTPNVRKRYAEQIKKRALEREHEKMTLQTALKSLAGKKVEFSAKTTKTGKLYAAITEQMISERLRSQFGVKVTADQLKIKEPIKAMGTHTVTIQSGTEMTQIMVEVKEEMTAKKAA